MALPTTEEECTRYRCNCSGSTDILGKFICATAGFVGNLPCTNPTCNAIGCGCQYGDVPTGGGGDGVPYSNKFIAGVTGVQAGPGSSCCGCSSGSGGSGSGGGSGGGGGIGGGGDSSSQSGIVTHGPWGINLFGIPWWVFATIVVIGAKAKKGA